jgi:hypothetical protein
MTRLNRRSFISGVSVTTAAIVSGCSGRGTGGGGSGPDEESSGGGGSGPDEQSSGPGDPLQVFERYWSTWENQNADAYRELFHSDSPERQKQYWNDDQFWAEFGLRDGVDWTIKERDLLESTETSATAREVYVWRPPDQPTVRITERWDLRTESSEWKLWEFVDQDVEELDSGESDSDEQQEESGSARFETNIEHADTMIAGQLETVTVSVENIGEQAGESEVMFKLHTVEDTKEISLASGQSTEFTFDFEVPNNPGSYNLRVATVASEEVIRNSVSIINTEDAFELTEVLKGDWECYQVSQFEDLESVDWEFEITNTAGVELESEEVILELRAYDGAKRTIGTFNSRGIAPSPGSSSVFRTNKQDMPEESCDYVEAIVEGTNENGGGLSVNDVE